MSLRKTSTSSLEAKIKKAARRLDIQLSDPLVEFIPKFHTPKSTTVLSQLSNNDSLLKAMALPPPLPDALPPPPQQDHRQQPVLQKPTFLCIHTHGPDYLSLLHQPHATPQPHSCYVLHFAMRLPSGPGLRQIRLDLSSNRQRMSKPKKTSFAVACPACSADNHVTYGGDSDAKADNSASSKPSTCGEPGAASACWPAGHHLRECLAAAQHSHTAPGLLDTLPALEIGWPTIRQPTTRRSTTPSTGCMTDYTSTSLPSSVATLK